MKYTVVYSEYFQVGSHSNSIVCYKHITTSEPINSENMEQLLMEHDIESTQVNFLFDGHCQPTE